MTWREYEPENIQKGRDDDCYYHFTITKKEAEALDIVMRLVDTTRRNVYGFGELEDVSDRLSELLEVFQSCADSIEA